MARILHLTDLHLGKAQPTDDMKSDILPMAARRQRVNSIGETLTAVGAHLSGLGERLDAIIVSGDITVAGAADGFEMLPSLLARLGDAAPETSRAVVVVPGNHDIARGAKSGSPLRYRAFRKLVDTQGYTAPALEGLDFSAGGTLLDPSRHYFIAKDSSWTIVPVNCADSYGSYEAISGAFNTAWKQLLAATPAKGQERLAKELNSLRLRDVARISPLQFSALREIVDLSDRAAERAGSNLLRISAVHHHLFPVTEFEEIKPFETLSNLGALRTFLARHKFAVVVHGHKHTRLAYWDHIVVPGAPPDGYRLLVLAGETLNGDQRKDQIAQLLELRGSSNAAILGLTSLPHCEIASEVANREQEVFHLWQSGDNAQQITVVRGATIDETYERLLAEFDGLAPETELQGFVCEVVDGASCGRLPTAYPPVEGLPDGDARQAWLDDLVAWWQTPWDWLEDYEFFSHGQRAAKPIVEGHGQLDIAISALASDGRSSRGVVILIEPARDVFYGGRRKFPAFTMFQLLVSGDSYAPRLDIIANFRKHELKWWWPVNVAELHHIQQSAIPRIREKLPNIVAGKIITVSGIVKIGKTAPQVAVPAIDRLVDEHPASLFELAYSCFHNSPAVPGTADRWSQAIDDLRPPADFNSDGVPVAIRGLSVLIGHLDAFQAATEPQRARKLISELQDVLDYNSDYSDKLTAATAGERDHVRWQGRVNPHLDEALKEALRLLASPL